MLIINRYPGQSIIIGDNIRIRVNTCNEAERETKLAIFAPREIPIVRQEVINRTLRKKSTNEIK